MTKAEVLDLLKANKNDRGIKNWNNLDIETGGLKSFGIGLTQLRKLSKQVGRDHKLALQLWKSDNHDAKIVGLLIDEPEKMTRDQAEKQVEGVEPGYLSHVFSSCDATLAKSSFAFDLSKKWMKSKDELRRRCAYGLVYEMSKDKRNEKLSDDFFLECIKRINATLKKEKVWVKASMGGALIGIGKRNKKLNKEAIKVAKGIGPREITYGDTNCEPLDILKHLTNERLQEKLKST